MWAGMRRRPAPSAGQQHLRFPHALYTRFSHVGKTTRDRLPGRSYSRRRLRSRHYRQLKRHMRLRFSGPGHPRARLPARSRETMSLYREIQAAAGWLSREAREARRKCGACALRSGAGPSRRAAERLRTSRRRS